MIRINKYLAERRYASRREADKLIVAGKVTINGRVAKLGDKVNLNDKVEVDLPKQAKIYLAFHKPRGLKMEEIKAPAGVFPLGRLDKESEGLIIFTNDGRLTSKLLAPAAHQEKEYLVVVDKPLDGLDLKHLSQGVKIENYRTKPAKVERLDDNTFRIILTEGKKHQIRRMCAALGYQVQGLKRTRIAKLRLGNLRAGTFRTIISEFIQSRNEQ